MDISSRANEIVDSTKSFQNEAYTKDELLNEYFLLQRELVELTFNEDHAHLADLKVWDVEKHLEQMNAARGGIANGELERFKSQAKELTNRIKAEISGKRGEDKAFSALEKLNIRNELLRNIELSDGAYRTEIDTIVITKTGITIVEVKNPHRDIFISEDGGYYRTGEYQRWDCNIQEKLNVKEHLLKEALQEKGYGDISIDSIVVFTNNNIEVHNRNHNIKTCFTCQLTSFIEKGSMYAGSIDMEGIKNAIETSAIHESYPIGFDVEELKRSFAMVMATLEAADADVNESGDDEVSEINERVHNGIAFILGLASGIAGAILCKSYAR